MGTKADRCRMCGRTVTAVVRTAGGFSRVCDEHATAIPNALSVAQLRPAEQKPGLTWQKHDLSDNDYAKRLEASLAGLPRFK